MSLQFGIALIVKQAAAHAVTVAAREAAKANPPTPEELEDIIERVLAGHQITIGPDAAFVVEVPQPAAAARHPPCHATRSRR